MQDIVHSVDIGDCTLHVVERGQGFPLIVVHGGPGLDHHEFSDYLDGLQDIRLFLLDLRGHGMSSKDTDPKCWTISQMANDISKLAKGLELEKYAVLGSSFGSFVALRHAVNFADNDGAAQTILSGCVPSLEEIAAEGNLQSFA